VLDGNSQRQGACHAGVSHGSVANWLKAHADSLPGPDEPVELAEQDELLTFIGANKTKPASMTIVHCATHCLRSIEAVVYRSRETAQHMVK
jgi:hypothetical protein